MTTAGAVQQPLTTLLLLQQQRMPLQAIFITSCAGCLGVVIALYFFNNLTSIWLNLLFISILVYHFAAAALNYFGLAELRIPVSR